jgi:hypothetical protein
MLITGAHSIIYSKNAVADRKFLKDILKLSNVDVGDGWLIFGFPPSEVAIHPHSENDVHELYLLCDDIGAFILEMKKNKIRCSEAIDRGWGILTELSLPGGGKIGIYQPKHKRPPVSKAVKKKSNIKLAKPKKIKSKAK